ncbi:hypothetical protein ACFSM7_13130 [Clavibacter michiganensis subsp. tessellarius]|uniref:hypothetical protein n=1 Tax=Clavibacter tessellarius TaxID=31965 RepID=UPI00363AED87
MDLSESKLGTLNLAETTISTLQTGALNITNAVIASDVTLTKARFISISKGTTFELQRARISGHLRMPGALLENDIASAMDCSGAVFSNNVLLNGGFKARGAGAGGTLRMIRTNINGQLAMKSAHLLNESGPAFIGDGLVSAGGIFMSNGFKAIGHSSLGAIRLLHAEIGNTLAFGSARLVNQAGPAFLAEGLTVSGTVFFNRGFRAVSRSKRAGLGLYGSKIKGQLIMRDSLHENHEGPAINITRSQIDGDAIFASLFAAFGEGELGAVRLASSTVGGAVSFRGAKVANMTGPALVVIEGSIGGNLQIDGELETLGAAGYSVVNLQRTEVRGTIALEEGSIKKALDGAQWAVDGLTFTSYPTVGFDAWLFLLKNGTPNYRPQPYQILASVSRALGHDADAKKAVITQLDDRVVRGHLPAPTRAWNIFTKASLRYGYQPWRALIGVLGVFLAALMLLVVNPDATQTLENKGPCNFTQQFKIAVDMVIPLVRTNTGARCLLVDSGAGELLSLVGVVLTLLGWALTALFAAGFTRAVRQI